MNPADAEAASRWPEAVGESDEARLSAANDDDPIQLRTLDELLDDRAPARRVGERSREALDQVAAGCEHAHAPLAARVDRLQHRRQPDPLEPAGRILKLGHDCELGLRHSAGCDRLPIHRSAIRVPDVDRPLGVA